MPDKPGPVSHCEPASVKPASEWGHRPPPGSPVLSASTGYRPPSPIIAPARWSGTYPTAAAPIPDLSLTHCGIAHWYRAPGTAEPASPHHHSATSNTSLPLSGVSITPAHQPPSSVTLHR